MKNVLKLKIAFFATAMLIIASCEKRSDAIPEDILQTQEQEKSIVIGGRSFKTGFGYSLTEQRVPGLIIDRNSFSDKKDDSFLEEIITNIGIVQNSSDLTTFLDRIDTLNIGKPTLFGGFTSEVRSRLQELISFDQQSLSVIARIAIKKEAYDITPNGSLSFDPRIQRFIDRGRIDRVLFRGGPAYVSRTVLGGDLYYVFSYNTSTITNDRLETFKNNLVTATNEIFGSASNTLTLADREEITSSRSSIQLLTRVNGYVPSLTITPQGVQEELNRFKEHLVNNSSDRSIIEIELRPYTDILDIPEFERAFNIGTGFDLVLKGVN